MQAGHLNIDPSKLLYLAAIIEHGSIKSAAKALNVSQPSLSTSMSRLEAELGMQVLERSNSGVIPTSVGEILYCHARLIRDELGNAERTLLNLHTGSTSIRVGSLPSLASIIVPTALSRWREIHRDRDLQVVEAAQIDLLVGLLRHEYDFVIGNTELYGMQDGLRQRVLFRDQLLVIARTDHPLSNAEDLNWQTLVSYPWVCATARRSHSFLDLALKTAKVAPPDHVTVCGSVTLLKSVVMNSNHLAVLPAHAVREEVNDGKIRSLPISDPALDRNIAVFYREGFCLDDISRELVNMIEAVGQELCRRPDADVNGQEFLEKVAAA